MNITHAQIMKALAERKVIEGDCLSFEPSNGGSPRHFIVHRGSRTSIAHIVDMGDEDGWCLGQTNAFTLQEMIAATDFMRVLGEGAQS